MENGLIVKGYELKYLEDNGYDFSYWDMFAALSTISENDEIEIIFDSDEERDRAKDFLNAINIK